MRNRCESQVNRWRCLGIPPPIVDTNPLRCPPFHFTEEGMQQQFRISGWHDIVTKNNKFFFFLNIKIKEKNTNEFSSSMTEWTTDHFFFSYEEEKGSENKTKEKKLKLWCGRWGDTEKRVDPERDDASPACVARRRQSTDAIRITTRHLYTHVHTRISLYFFSIILAWHSMKKQKTSRVSYELIIDPPFEFWISLVFLKRKRNNKTWIGNISKTLLCVVWYYNLATTFLIYQRKIEMQNEQDKTWIVMENKTRKKKKKKNGRSSLLFVCLLLNAATYPKSIGRCRPFFFFFDLFYLKDS